MNALLKRTLIVALAAASTPRIFGEPAKTDAAKTAPTPPRSVFVTPTNPREGRDPFFPESMRPYEEFAPAVTTTKPVEVDNVFTVKGLSVEHGRAMVIINNHTFAEGDDEYVSTANGRVRLKLVEIRPGVAVIEVSGTKLELKISDK